MLSIALALALAAPIAAMDTAAIDACAVAPVGQLRFLIAAGIARFFPITQSGGGTQVEVANPTLVAATCSPLTVELRATLRTASSAGDVRLTAQLFGRATFRGAHPATPTASTLAEAGLCFRDVTLITAGAPVDTAQLHKRLRDALVGAGCFDITSLAFAFLERGGTLRPPGIEKIVGARRRASVRRLTQHPGLSLTNHPVRTNAGPTSEIRDLISDFPPSTESTHGEATREVSWLLPVEAEETESVGPRPAVG